MNIFTLRPDSTIDGVNVHLARAKAGECLAWLSGECRVVIAVRSGRSAAIGFANKSGTLWGRIMKINMWDAPLFGRGRGSGVRG